MVEFPLHSLLMSSPQVWAPGDFENTDVVALARSLIGQVWVTEIGGIRTAGIITETEAYRAPEDRASHAYGNRRTSRTEVMFGPAGTAYVYLCYGIHHLFNIVTGPIDCAHAVLIRSIEPLEGLDSMLARRGMNQPAYRLTSGPGSCARAMGMHTSFTGQALIRENGCWVQSGIPTDQISTVSARRVGVDYAGEWAEKPWRYFAQDSPWVSKRSAK